MDRDPRTCYQAVLSRDARFDGRFFTGVVTTGVYCRPICPARPPKQENVRFFACAAAAEQAGFRPCRRCRPETSPGTPAWIGTSTTVSRALRLIAEGALDAGNVDDLADRLGIGARHLRRLFDEHLGASPVAIAQTRRVHFARRLIDESDLTMIELAHCAGFSSVRRFNVAFREAFGKPPGELRRASKSSQGRPPHEGLALKLPFRPPYDWAAIMRFLRERAIPGVEAVDEHAYRRSIAIAGPTAAGGRVAAKGLAAAGGSVPAGGSSPEAGWMEATASAGSIEVRRVSGKSHLLLRLRVPATTDLPRIVERVRLIFDLGADPLPIATHLGSDPLLARAVRAHPGMRVPGCWNGFELAVRAILGQQVTVKGASTLAGRLVRAFGTPVDFPNAPGISHLFPTPAALAIADLASAGLTRPRASAIRALAVAVRDRAIDLEEPGDTEAIVSLLCALPGVGPWTAYYIAMRALGDPDAMPPGDLGLRKAISTRKKNATDRDVVALSRGWSPWRSYAAMHLWATLE